METPVDAGSTPEKEVSGHKGSRGHLERVQVLVVGDGPESSKAIKALEGLRNKGASIVIAVDPGYERRKAMLALAAMKLEEVSMVEPKEVEYGDYRKFLPRKKQRW